MTTADLIHAAAQTAAVLACSALIFTPGLLLAALHHLIRRTAARRAWAATTRATAAEYAQDEPLLDDVAHIVDTHADQIAPLYGKGE